MKQVRPQIFHIIPHDGVGGVEVAARSMLRRDDLPCEFTLLLLAGRTFAPDASRVIESPYGSPLNPMAYLRALRICIRRQPEVIIFSLWKSVPIAILIRLLCRKSRLVFFLNLEKPAHLIDSLGSKVAVLCAQEVWADSRTTLQARLGGENRVGSRVISFVTEPLAPPPDEQRPARPSFISWSRLARQKGIDRAIALCAELKKAGIIPRFEIWGPDHGELEHLEQLRDRLGMEEQIMFGGPVAEEDLPRIAANASFFLQLSRSEGMAMATVEAMQLGLVPITTPVGEMARYVVNGRTGIVVDCEAMAPAVAEIKRVLDDPQEYSRLQAEAVQFWRGAPLYADDVCQASNDLLSRAVRSEPYGKP